MAFNILRKATDEDTRRVNKAWARFCKRYPDYTFEDVVGIIEKKDEGGNSLSWLASRWEKVIHRALFYKEPVRIDIKHPLGLCGEYIGTSGW